MRHIEKLHSCSGAVVLEAALSFATYSFLLFVGLQLAIVGYKKISLNYTVASSVRWASLGQTLCSPTSSDCSQMMNREQSIEYRVREIGAAYGLDFGHATFNPNQDQKNIHVCPISDRNCSTDHAGPAGGFFIVKAAQPYSLLGFPIMLEASMTSRTEGPINL